MKDYLENQKQFVQLNDHSSDYKYVLNGFPQGSIEAPFLFWIYINDILISSIFFIFLLYADDTTLFCNLEDIDNDNKDFTLNWELRHVHELLLANIVYRPGYFTVHPPPPTRLQVDQNFLTQKIVADLKMRCHQKSFGIWRVTEAILGQKTCFISKNIFWKKFIINHTIF